VKVQASGVREQDIDLLHWEEFVTSPAFLTWFLEEAGVPNRGDLVSAARSVTAVNGESDLELEVRAASVITKILIENKIDAPLQRLQAARYRDPRGIRAAR